MRKVVTTHFVSVDGKVDPTGGDPALHETAWTFRTVDFLMDAYELKGQEQEDAGALMFGRVSYVGFAPVWPTMEEFTRFNTLPKYVVSTTLKEDDLVENWGEITILRSLDDVAALKETEGAEIQVHGSASLTRSLMDAGLVDEIHTLVFPVLLGQGKPLFSDTDKPAQKLELLDHAAYANGIQKQVFKVVR